MDCLSSMPLVSIIVPVYKVERYLKECVDSIRNQTLREIEIILVDDGSPDVCPLLCDQFAAEDDRVYVHHQENAGVSAARNQGMEMASAEWLMFVDGDDWLEENAAEILYRKASETQCEIVCGSFFRNYPDKQEPVQPEGVGEKEYTVRENQQFLFECVICRTVPGEESWLRGPWTKLYRAEYLRAHHITFPTRIKWSEDLIFNLHAVYYAEKIYLSDVPVYHYRMRRSSVSHILSSWKVEDLMKAYTVMYTFAKEHRMEKYLVPYYYGSSMSDVIHCINERCVNVRHIDTFRAAVRSVMEFAEHPECRKVILHVDSKLLSRKRRLVLSLLRLKMYRTLVAVRVIYRKWFKKEEREQMFD